MSECKHTWEMIDIRFGYVAFEKCFHCDGIRTYFSEDDNFLLGDKYREGAHFWTRVDNAQTFQFNLQCHRCKETENFGELMGLMYCTDCMADCDLAVLQKKYEQQGVGMLIAFGFFPQAMRKPIPPYKLEILSEYFNQRRDSSRKNIKFMSFDLIKDLSLCRGDFLHDIGMLSQEPVTERKSYFLK